MAAQLTAGDIREVLHYDPQTGDFWWKIARGSRRAGSRAGFVGSNGYVRIRISGKDYFAHRLAWAYVYGEWPRFDLDHVNVLPSDNRIENLRPARQHQNSSNQPRRKNNSSGFKGVYRNKARGMWRAQISVKGRRKNLGDFTSRRAAYAAYCRASEIYHGEYGRVA